MYAYIGYQCLISYIKEYKCNLNLDSVDNYVLCVNKNTYLPSFHCAFSLNLKQFSEGPTLSWVSHFLYLAKIHNPSLG